MLKREEDLMFDFRKELESTKQVTSSELENVEALLNREDLPNWKKMELKHRKQYLQARVEVIDEMLEYLERQKN